MFERVEDDEEPDDEPRTLRSFEASHHAREGYEAAMSGKPLTANPWPEGGRGYVDWINGWFFGTSPRLTKDRENKRKRREAKKQ